MLFLLLGAGSETTTHLISGSVFELLKDPARRDWLAADWRRADLAVEEFLRFVAPVQFSKPRYVREDVEIEGISLKRGDQVMAMIAAANFDAAANEHPERLDLARRPNRHLSFGTGIHFCLGHQLARLEGILPALESSHAIAQAMISAKARKPDEAIVVCLSGRGDKDVYEVARVLGQTI